MLRDANRTKKPGNVGILSKQGVGVFQIPLFLKIYQVIFDQPKYPPIILNFFVQTKNVSKVIKCKINHKFLTNIGFPYQGGEGPATRRNSHVFPFSFVLESSEMVSAFTKVTWAWPSFLPLMKRPFPILLQKSKRLLKFFGLNS